MRRRASAGLARFGASVLALAFSGCATFSDLPAPPPRAPLAVPEENPMSGLDVFVQTAYVPGEYDWPHEPQPVVAHKNYAVDALRRSGWFSRVTVVGETDPADATVRIKKYITAVKGAYFELFTLFLVPSATDWRISVSVTLHPERPSGPTCGRGISYRTWRELFLLPFSFTHTQGAFEQKAVERLTLSCFARLLRDEGLLVERPGP